MINGRRPFTEMFEVCQAELCREAASNQDDKYKGFINQVYVNELASILPETYLKKEAYITTVAEYTTGTVTVGTGTAGIQGALTTFTTAHTNRWIAVDGVDNLFRVTFSADTFLTLQNSLTWVEDSGTGLGYTLFQDRYQLASDFAYMMADNPEDPNVVSYFNAGSRLFLDPWTNEEYDRNFVGVVGDNLTAYTVKWIAEVPYIFFAYAPETAQILSYWYIPILSGMTEYVTGTVTFAASTAVVGAGMAWALSANIDTAVNTYYIRNDADGTGSSSRWQQILSVANATALTLSSAWGGSTGTGCSYTISQVSKWPARFDDAILYKAAMIADPDNTQLQKWSALYQEGVNLDKSVDIKRRTASQWKFPGRR